MLMPTNTLLKLRKDLVTTDELALIVKLEKNQYAYDGL